MFNVNEGKEQSLITQRRGRVTGKGKKKSFAVIMDIFDNIKHLKEHSMSRLEAYEELSKENIEVFFTDSEEFLNDLELCLLDCFND